jgi:heme o synthase
MKRIKRLPDLQYRSPFARLSLANFIVMLVLMISGILVRVTGATSACNGWPLCQPGILIPDSPLAWLDMAHRLIVLISAVFLLRLLIQAWRTQRSQTSVLVSTTGLVLVFFLEALLGGIKVLRDFPEYLVVLHGLTGVAIWMTLATQVFLVGLVARTRTEERHEIQSAVRRQRLFKDFLALTKPIVVALLLVTTYAGMVIGAKAWPSWEMTFWVMLGGFMAAGGSGAINQFIDRYDDIKMQRTQKRPIPSGRLTPGEGLAFGVAMALTSFYIMAIFINLLSALLTLAGIIYYVLLYSIFLKKASVQNIVIGGGAGAIPPLVGWAAATGSLNIPSLFLFAVVFMWTPPHFWALAIVRRKDYARAGVPMMPVVRGEKETRTQIFIYTIELVALTLFLPLFGLGGSIYFVAALVLGGALLYSAWKVWQKGGNKLAWNMYRHSSMYLAFLFVALMVDALILA